MKKTLIITFLILNFFNQGYSQTKKYGEISKDEFREIEDFEDANAVVLFKTRKTELIFHNNEGWNLVTTIRERIIINNKEGFKHATKKIKYYHGNRTNDELISVKASTYNLTNNEITKTDLNKNNIYKKKINNKWGEKTFTMPNLQNGSIIEWEYKIISNYFYVIDDVVFQYDIPVKYFNAKIRILDHLKFNYFLNKKFKAKIDKSKGLEVTLRNIPPLKKEPFVRNMEHYRGKIRFEVIATNFPNNAYKNYAKTWNDVTKSVYEDDRFGKQLKKNNYFKDDLEDLLKNKGTQSEKLLSILQFVKNKVKWDKSYYQKFTENGVKKAYINGIGNIAEINLILTSMLQKAGFNANPVLVSSYKKRSPYYPTISGLNYLVVAVTFDTKTILLDASEKYSYIDLLPLRAINWNGRLIRKDGTSDFIKLTPENYSLDKKRVHVTINENGETSGTIQSIYTNLNALTKRKELNQLTENSIIKKLENKYKGIEITNVRTLNNEDLTKPFIVSANYKIINGTEKIQQKLVFSPLFFLEKNEHTFKSNTRNFPIDFNTPFKNHFTISIDIPKNYKVDYLPENKKIDFKDEQGNFSYKIVAKNQRINIITVFEIKKTQIQPEDYSEFKSAYQEMILKQTEKIILVKD